jgi:hypothetical protein
MKKFLLFGIFLFIIGHITAQVDQYDPACSTPDLNSATAVSLPKQAKEPSICIEQFIENSFDIL